MLDMHILKGERLFLAPPRAVQVWVVQSGCGTYQIQDDNPRIVGKNDLIEIVPHSRPVLANVGHEPLILRRLPPKPAL